MTVSIAIVRNPDYYQDDIPDAIEYYSDRAGAEAKAKPDSARWFGALAKELGLEGQLMTAEDSIYLLNGFNPKHKIPATMSALEAKAAGMLKPLRKSADAEALGMSLLSREVKQIKDAAKLRTLDAFETKKLAQAEVELSAWNAKLKETREVAQEHDRLAAGKKAEIVWDEELQAKVPYNDKHEERREALGKKLSELPGGQRQAVDLTASLCKEMSIVYAMGDDEEKGLMRQAFQEEYSSALEEALELFGQARDFSNKKRGEAPSFVRAGGIAAVVIHDTTRAVRENGEFGPDLDTVDGGEQANLRVGEVLKGMAPSLHAHGIVLNLSIDENGKTRSLTTEELEDFRKILDTMVHARLVARMNTTVNSRGERFCAFDAAPPHGKAVVGIAAPGVNREDVESVSGRSLAIKELREKAAEEGKKVDYSYGKLETREAKVHDADLGELYAHWKEHLGARGISRETLGMGAEGKKAREQVDQARAARAELHKALGSVMDIDLLNKVCSGKNYFTPSELRLALWQDAIATGDMNVEARMERILNNSVLTRQADQAEVASLMEGKKMRQQKEPVFVLGQAMVEEMDFDNVYSRLTIGGAKTFDREKIREVIAKTEQERQQGGKKFEWREDQKAVIEGILTSESRALVVKAPPGSGKTTALGAVVEFCKQESIDHIILSPSWKATNQAKADAKMEIGYAIQGFVRTSAALDQIKPGTMVFVDESSMVDMPDMLKLMQEVDKRGGRVVAFGDTRQLAAVGRGDPMKRMQEVAPDSVLELTHITRQNGDAIEHRKFVMAQYEGRHEDFVNQLEEQGLIKIYDSVAEKRAALAADFLADAAPMEQRTITGGTNEECAIVNAAIRKGLIQNGELGSNAVSIPCETQLGLNDREFRIGERILFLAPVEGKNDKGEDARVADTADVGTVVGFKVSEDGKSVAFKVAVDGKGLVDFDAKSGIQIDHAYMITTHRAQGITQEFTPHSFDISMSGAESLLVGLSRHRARTAMYCTRAERAALLAAAARESEKIRARDIAGQPITTAEAEANRLLVALGRDLRRALHVGKTEAIDAVVQRYHSIEKQIERAGGAFLNKAKAYEAVKVEALQVRTPAESEADAFARRVAKEAAQGIDDYKALAVSHTEADAAKAAGAVWIAERNSWIAPKDKEAALLALFAERKDLGQGSIERPMGIKGVSKIEGYVQGLDVRGKNLLVIDNEGLCRAVPLTGLLAGHMKDWSHEKNLGQRIAELRGARVELSLDPADVGKELKSVQVKSTVGDTSIAFELDKGALVAVQGGAKAKINRRGLAETAGIDARQARMEHQSASFDRRCAASIVLAVPFEERELARAAGAVYDRDAAVWFAPSGADLEPMRRWSALQVPVEFEVPFEDSALAKGIPGVRWDREKAKHVAKPGTSLAALEKLLDGYDAPGRDRMGRHILDVPYADKEKAKAAGARWDPELRAYVGPRDMPRELLDLWKPASAAPEGSRLNPLGAQALADRSEILAFAEHANDKAGVLSLRSAAGDEHYALAAGQGTLLGAKAFGWSESLGSKLADLSADGFKVAVKLDKGQAVEVSIERQSERGAYQARLALDDQGRLKAIDAAGKPVKVEEDLRLMLGFTPTEAGAIAQRAREDALARRAAVSTILAVPKDRANEAKAAGAKWDPENRTWFAGAGAKMEALSAFACSQARSDLRVPFEKKDEAKKLGARWDAESKVWYAPAGTAVATLKEMASWAPALAKEAEALAAQTADSAKAAREANAERQLREGSIGTTEKPIPMAALPERFFEGGSAAGVYVRSFKGVKTGAHFAVFKALDQNGQPVFFTAKAEGHQLFKALPELDNMSVASSPRVNIVREADGSLGRVDLPELGRALVSNTQALEAPEAKAYIEERAVRQAGEKALKDAREAILAPMDQAIEKEKARVEGRRADMEQAQSELKAEIAKQRREALKVSNERMAAPAENRADAARLAAEAKAGEAPPKGKMEVSEAAMADGKLYVRDDKTKKVYALAVAGLLAAKAANGQGLAEALAKHSRSEFKMLADITFGDGGQARSSMGLREQGGKLVHDASSLTRAGKQAEIVSIRHGEVKPSIETLSLSRKLEQAKSAFERAEEGLKAMVGQREQAKAQFDEAGKTAKGPSLMEKAKALFSQALPGLSMTPDQIKAKQEREAAALRAERDKLDAKIKEEEAAKKAEAAKAAQEAQIVKPAPTPSRLQEARANRTREIFSNLDAAMSQGNGPLKKTYWAKAVKMLVEDNYDPKTMVNGRLLIHRLAEVGPSMDGAVQTGQGVLSPKTAMSLAIAQFGDDAMEQKDSQGRSVEDAQARGEALAAKEREQKAKELAAAPEGASIDKPIDASKQKDKILEGYVERVDRDAVVLRAVEGKKSVFYRIEREGGAFGTEELPGIEAAERSKPISIALENGKATKALVVPPGAGANAAPKEAARQQNGLYRFLTSTEEIEPRKAIDRSAIAQRALARGKDAGRSV